MKNFEVSPPDVGGNEVRVFRTASADEILDALKALAPPFSDEVKGELIALGYVHGAPGVRKKAIALVKKHIPDEAAIKATLKTLANASGGVVDERLQTLAHPLTRFIARAMLFHSRTAVGTAFLHDAEVRAQLLEIQLERALREKSDTLFLDEVYWYWRGSHGSCANPKFATLPSTFVDELSALRKKHAFTGLRFHGCGLTALPPNFGALKGWLQKLSLNYSAFTELPKEVLELEKLEALSVLGTEMTDLPDLSSLKKLKRLDIGNGKKMKSIPLSVCANSTLEWLRIGNGSIRKIPDEISGMRSLQELELQSAPVRKLPKSMAAMSALKRVNVRWTGVSVDAARAVLAPNVKIES